MEKSCLGSKCVAPSSSSPVPDTSAKVTYSWHISAKTSFNSNTNHLFFYSFSSPLSLASSDRLQKGEASSSWSCARSTETPASLRLPVSAPPLRPAALMTPPVFLEILTIGGAGRSPRYGTLRGPWKTFCKWFTVMQTAQGRLEKVHSCCHLEMSKVGKLFWWIFPVKSVPGKRPPPMVY